MEKDIVDFLRERDNIINQIEKAKVDEKIDEGYKEVLLEEMNRCLLDLNNKINNY